MLHKYLPSIGDFSCLGWLKSKNMFWASFSPAASNNWSVTQSWQQAGAKSNPHLTATQFLIKAKIVYFLKRFLYSFVCMSIRIYLCSKMNLGFGTNIVQSPKSVIYFFGFCSTVYHHHTLAFGYFSARKLHENTSTICHRARWKSMTSHIDFLSRQTEKRFD